MDAEITMAVQDLNRYIIDVVVKEKMWWTLRMTHYFLIEVDDVNLTFEHR